MSSEWCSLLPSTQILHLFTTPIPTSTVIEELIKQERYGVSSSNSELRKGQECCVKKRIVVYFQIGNKCLEGGKFESLRH